MVKAVFLDRDGTLIEDKPYSVNPDDIELLPGVVDGLRALGGAGYDLIVVTNQSGIARGFYDARALAVMHDRLTAMLLEAGIEIRAYYFCPHHVEGQIRRFARSCRCRKPGPGMILRAAWDWNVDLESSWTIGNCLTDAQAARAAGCRAMIVERGRTTDLAVSVASFAEAARYIIDCDARDRLAMVGVPRRVRRE